MYEKGGRRTYLVRWSLFLSLNDSPYLIFRFWHTSTKASADISARRVHSPESLEGLSESSCMEGVISQVSTLRD